MSKSYLNIGIKYFLNTIKKEYLKSIKIFFFFCIFGEIQKFLFNYFFHKVNCIFIFLLSLFDDCMVLAVVLMLRFWQIKRGKIYDTNFEIIMQLKYNNSLIIIWLTLFHVPLWHPCRIFSKNVVTFLILDIPHLDVQYL